MHTISSAFPRLSRLCATIILVAVCPATFANVIYTESSDGDFANTSSLATTLSLSEGSNEIFGTTGRVLAVDRDYFTLTVPTGYLLTEINLLSGTTSGGVSFIGMESGPEITLPSNSANAAGLLGWWHYSPADIGQDLLAKMSTPANGSSGFTAPLPAGDYAFWVQDFSSGTFDYGLDFHLANVPDSGPGFLSCAAAVGLFAAHRRTRRAVLA